MSSISSISYSTMNLYKCLLLLTFLLGIFVSKTLSGPTPPDVDSVVGQTQWLEQFNYLGAKSIIPGISSLTSSEAFVKAVKMLQRFLSLPETGVVDEKTKSYMKEKRCGLNDMSDASMFTKRRRRYILQGSQYPAGKVLTYRINIYSSKLSESTQELIFRRAFDFWEGVANIKFQQIRDRRSVDIDIMFATGSHGDYESFDGRGGILAHAFFPNFGGDEHFDDAESWSHEESRGTNMLQTVTHEIGHTLGLSHSGDANSIMFPYIKPYDPYFSLGKDDITGIQVLYGPPDKFTQKPTPAPTNTPPPMAPPQQPPYIPPQTPKNPFDSCDVGRIDAITQTSDKSTYIFKGEYVYKINGLGVEYGYPVKIDDAQFGFSPMIGPIDAALYWPLDGRTFLFKDYYVAAFYGRTFDRYYYTEDILSIPFEAKQMDTVFHWPRNGKTYLTKGDLYWRFETGSGRLDPGYPQTMDKWSLPGGVDAAFEYSNGRTYFFKGSQYYKFDDSNIKLEEGYPRPTNYWWFGCRGAGASSGLVQPEGKETDPQMNIVQPVENENLFATENSSPKTQGSIVSTCGFLLLCILHRFHNLS